MEKAVGNILKVHIAGDSFFLGASDIHVDILHMFFG